LLAQDFSSNSEVCAPVLLTQPWEIASEELPQQQQQQQPAADL